MEIIKVKLLPKWKLALESAVRVFIYAAGPAAYGAWEASGHSLTKAALLAAAGDGAAAGLAALGRVLKPSVTDAVGVGARPAK